MLRKLVVEIIVFLFILLFLYTAASKLLDYKSFSNQVGFSPLLRGIGFQKVWGIWIAWIIPVAEILVAVLLMLNRFRLVALYASFGLMMMFTLYILYILNVAPYRPCSCGGVLNSLGWTEHLYFNAGFIALGLAGIFLHAPDRSVKQLQHENTKVINF